MDCICGRLYVGGRETGAINWMADCPQHGIYSEWWNSAERKRERQEERERLRDLQRQAAEARRKALEEAAAAAEDEHDVLLSVSGIRYLHDMLVEINGGSNDDETVVDLIETFAPFLR